MTTVNKLSVLVVDDTAAIRERLVAMISNLPGIEALAPVGCAREAYARMNVSMPDVLLLDVLMPEINGIEMLRTIKKTKPSPIVMMLTSYPFPQYRELCMKAGADFFFEKSTEFNLLAGTLARLGCERAPRATGTQNETRFTTARFNEQTLTVTTGDKE